LLGDAHEQQRHRHPLRAAALDKPSPPFYAGIMEIERLPEIERPNIIAAFQGWNDAGQAATTAVRYLIDTWSAKKFAHIDPEDYFSFTDTRPVIRIVDGSQRELSWPSNEFYYYAGGVTRPAAVLLVGTEPNLKWRTFCNEVVYLSRQLDARRVVTLGALITDAVHTRPVPLTGFSTDVAVQERFAARSITRSNYEGPTGIVGTLHNLCTKAGITTASIWAATPHYLGATPNPKTALGLLDAIDDALGLGLNLGELRRVAQEFGDQVSLAIKDNDEVQEHIRLLEQRYDEQGGAPAPSEGGPLPESSAIIADLESFLREQRDAD
jgi:proteasome assembly chaperone (PAC2) family protein